MVHAALTTVALLAMSRAVGAVPTVANTITSNFSFADWVDGIIADPDGDHLTPAQAVAAFHAGRNQTLSPSDHQKRALLGKRVVCDEQPNSAARVTDAVDCINYLASIRGTPCQIWLNYSSFRTSGTAEIDGHSSKKTQSDCNDIARAGGLILDNCARTDGNVEGSQNAWGNDDILVRIHLIGQR